MLRRLFILAGLLACTVSVAAAPPVLPDQYGASAGLNDYAGKPVLVIIASGRKLRWIGQWEKALRAKIPGLVSLRVADIVEEPRPQEAEVAAVLQKRAPPGISILIDRQNEWATAFELDTREPCLLLFDSQHNVVARFRGRPRNPLFDEVIAALGTYFPLADS